MRLFSGKEVRRAELLGDTGHVFGPEPASVDAAIYGFVANIYCYDIDTPLKQYVLSGPALVRHCETLHERIGTRDVPLS